MVKSTEYIQDVCNTMKQVTQIFNYS